MECATSFIISFMCLISLQLLFNVYNFRNVLQKQQQNTHTRARALTRTQASHFVLRCTHSKIRWIQYLKVKRKKHPLPSPSSSAAWPCTYRVVLYRIHCYCRCCSPTLSLCCYLICKLKLVLCILGRNRWETEKVLVVRSVSERKRFYEIFYNESAIFTKHHHQNKRPTK